MKEADTTMQPSEESTSNNSTNSGSSTPHQQQINTTRRKENNSPSSYTVLIVDDEPDTTFTYRSVLEGAGFKVDVFNDPLAALSRLKETYSSYPPDTTTMPDATTTTIATTTNATSTKKPYDLMLLDIKMPKMNGFELYREIKEIIKEEKEEHVKICFITAHELYYEQLKQEFPKIDVGCYIKKPIDANDLIKRVKQELYH